MFDKEEANLSAEQKRTYQDFFSTASKNGAYLFQDVVSFDTNFLIEQGIYDPMTKELNDKRLKQAIRRMMARYFDREGLNETGQWVGAIHYNTDPFHIHFTTTESYNTRQPISITDKVTGEKKKS